MGGLSASDEDSSTSPHYYVFLLRPQLTKGFMQLYSFVLQKSQLFKAHAAGFSYVKVCRSFDQQKVLSGSCEDLASFDSCFFPSGTTQFAGSYAAALVIVFAQKTLMDGRIISKLHVNELGAGGRKWLYQCMYLWRVHNDEIHLVTTFSCKHAHAMSQSYGPNTHACMLNLHVHSWRCCQAPG